MKKQIIAYLLLVSTLQIFACAEKTPSGVNSGTESSDNAVTTEGETTIPDNLPDENYGGYEFRLFVPDDAANVYAPESETGEIVDDAIYRRNRTVEERFKVKITSISSGKTNSDEHLAEVTKLVQSGEDAADIILGNGKKLSNLALQGYFVNIREIAHLDFTKPWWSA